MVVDQFLRKRILQLYREILRTGRKWSAVDPAQTAQEKQYIQEEARRLFKRNKNVSCEEEIKMCVKEAEQRLEIAIHYQNPYPRHINLPQNTIPPTGRRKFKGRERTVTQSTPLYYKSYTQDEKDSSEKT